MVTDKDEKIEAEMEEELKRRRSRRSRRSRRISQPASGSSLQILRQPNAN